MCALFTALLCLCAWLAVPVGDIYITMQTFGICITLLLLGGKYGSISIFAYLLLGAVGLPVFSGFRGGMGVLLGPTGGYIWGFWISALVYWLFTALFKDNSPVRLISLCLELVLCYLLGSLWYMHAYLHGQSFIFVLAIDAGHLNHAECANLLALPGTHTLFVSHGINLLCKQL